jgi:GDP-4-dehydro-6-deoxy-D-mannose reductase
VSKILITGANGAIGEVLIQKLVEDGHELVVIDSKSKRLQNDDYFDDVENPSEIDLVYHLAALSNVPDSWSNPYQFININTLGTQKVLEFCSKYEVKLNFISSYIYGSPDYLPIDEKHPLNVSNPYALSKKMAEELVRFYGDYFSLEYNIIRPFNVYGSSKNAKLLIPEIIEQIKKGEEVKVLDLRPKRDYVYIDDLATFLSKCSKRFCNGPVNVGSGVSHSVEEVVKLCIEVWGRDEISYSSNQIERRNEVSETICDYSLAKEFFGWVPKYTLREGLQKMKSES